MNNLNETEQSSDIKDEIILDLLNSGKNLPASFSNVGKGIYQTTKHA